MDSDLLEQAVAHIRAGRPADARRLLAQLLDKDPHNEAAWFWLVETMPTAEQRISVLQQCLRFNPQSRPARLGLDKLTTQHQTPSAQPPAPTSPAESSAQPSQSPGMLSRMKPPAETNQPPAGQKPPEPEEDLFASLRQPAASEEDFFANLRQPSEQQQEPEPEGDLFASLRQPAASEEDFFANLRQPSEQQQEPEPKGDYFASLRPPAELEDHLFSALIASTEPEPKSSFQEPLPPPSRKDFPALEERVFLEDAPSQRGSKESADKGPTQKKDEVVDEAASIEPVELKDLQELRKKGRRRIPIWRYLLPPFGLVLLLAGLYLFFAYDVPSQLREVPFVARVFFPTATLTPTPTLTPTVTNTPSPTPTRTPRPSITPTFTPSPTLPPEYGVGQIIFSSSRSIRTIDLFLVNADGSGLSNLTADRMAPDNHPDWSPDGSQIVFESEDEIFVMTLPDGRPVNLTNDPARDFQPDWSPDGNDIVFVSNRTESSEIYIMRSNGSGVTLVPTLNTAKFWPAWSPDGTQIVFAALQDGNFDLYIVNRDGSSLRRLTNTPHSEITPAWSPDGSSIAFASNQDRNNNIFVIDASGGEPLRLTDNNFDDEFPAWSPDGRWIVFSTGREGRDTTSLYVMRSDGSDQTLLIQTSAIDIEPAWIR